jgi:hypothetical protein
MVGVEINLYIESMNVYSQKYNNIMARYITYLQELQCHCYTGAVAPYTINS